MATNSVKITIESSIPAQIDTVWRVFNNPDDILQWDACDDWHTAKVSNDLRLGGILSQRIEANDGATGFDVTATYTRIEPNRLIEFRMDDECVVCLEFIETRTGVIIRQTFDANPSIPIDDQRSEWQAVLDSFTRHVATIEKS